MAMRNGFRLWAPMIVAALCAATSVAQEVNGTSVDRGESTVPEATSVAAETASAPAEIVSDCADCAPAPKPAPKPKPYKGVFYDNDFSYLDTPGAERTEYFELLKRRHLTDRIWFDVGGEYRHQFKNENRRSLFTGVPSTPRTDTFTLDRLRLYTDLHVGDSFRAYVEYLDAVSNYEDLPPLGIDEDRSDLLNAFGEARLPFAPGDSTLRLRIGRQELLEGQQRLVSPLDWANTRRTFEGAKLISEGKRWDTRLFWTRPVLVDKGRFDQPDQSKWFAGMYSTYKCFKHQKVSPYFLILREEDQIPGPAAGQGHRIGSGQVDSRIYTAGALFEGGMDNWLWDLEGASQFGEYGNLDIFAGMVAAGVGRKMPNRRWAPTLWMRYDYASGDEDPTDGTVGSFNHLFPLGHKWFGFLDLVARTNIHDLNAQFFLKPHKKVTLLAWGHLFWLAEDRDGLYNAADIVSFQDATGASGNEVGQEIDLTANIAIRPGVGLLLGYSHFWSGDFVRNQGGQNSAYLLYSQMSIKY